MGNRVKEKYRGRKQHDRGGNTCGKFKKSAASPFPAAITMWTTGELKKEV